MRAFSYARAVSAREAVSQYRPGAVYLGGGTNLVDLMRLGVAAPDHVIDVTNALRDDISGTDDGGLRIGAAVRNSDLAAHPAIRRDYPLLARAVLTGASGQIRNAATVGGNLLQRTRCPYFQDVTMPCNKRSPGSGCQATRPGADTEHLAILGHSPFCVATHPSDMAVALTALGARVRVVGPDGDRWLEMPGLHRLPDGLPERDTALRPGGRLPGRARRGRARAVARARRGTGRPRPAAGPGTDAEAGHRVEGTDKVTGRARYAHEYPVPDAVHAFPVLAPVARGRIGEIDPGRALAMPGVLAVVGGVTTLTFGADDFEPALFTSAEVTYRGQLVAVAIADTAENARAAGAVTYTTPVEHNNPMEPHAAVAARAVGRPVKVALTRQPALRTTHRLVRLNVPAPSWMRAPGGDPGDVRA